MNMNSSNSNSPSLGARERRRTAMACMNCRSRKLKCRPRDSADNSPCDRCIKDNVLCVYRPVESNSQTPDGQENSITLHYVYPTVPPDQEPIVPVTHTEYLHTQGGGYVLNPPFDPTMQPFQTNPHYPTTPGQQQYPASQYPHVNTFPPGYPPYSNYQSSSQFGGHPQYIGMSYPPAHGQGNGPYDHRDHPSNGYGNM